MINLAAFACSGVDQSDKGQHLHAEEVAELGKTVIVEQYSKGVQAIRRGIEADVADEADGVLAAIAK